MVRDNCSEKEAYIKSKNDGIEWIKRNLSIKELNNPKIRVIHWDEILFDKAFSSKLALIQRLYKEKPEVKRKVDLEIDEFLSRKGSSSDYVFTQDSCEAFILEEISAFQVLAGHKREVIDVYPGAPIFLTITENKDTPELRAMYDTQIRFIKNKNYNNEQKIVYSNPLRTNIKHNSDIKELLIG